MALYRYRLIDSDGGDLGPFVSSSADWQPGDTIPQAPTGRRECRGGNWVDRTRTADSLRSNEC